MRFPSPTRLAMVATVAAFSGMLVACDSILKVNNPEQIPVAALEDTALISAQVAGVLAQFQDEFTRSSGALLWSANFITDETVTGLNWEDYARVNQRIVNYTEGPVFLIWGGLSGIIRQAEDVSARIEALLSAQDKRLALTSVYAGYGYTLTGETMCMADFGTAENPGTSVETPDAIFARAVPWFQKAPGPRGPGPGLPEHGQLRRGDSGGLGGAGQLPVLGRVFGLADRPQHGPLWS